MAGSRTEVQILNQQEPSEDGNRFPGRGRTLVEQEPPRESAQVNRQDQGGGDGMRYQIHHNDIMADSNAQNVGASNFGQGQREGQPDGYDIFGNKITAHGGASNVGFHNFGNNRPGWKCCIL